MKIETNILAVLESAQTTGNRLVLTGQLDRKTYTETNKVLEALGGKWDRKAKAHLFDGDAADLLEDVLQSGEYSRTKQDLGQFDTPEALAADLVRRARVGAGSVCLEPSAGIGRIARAAHAVGARVFCWEIDGYRAERLLPFSESVNVADFLRVRPETIFDAVVMNPPFARQADILHVEHAAKFLRPGGRMVAVMSASVLFRQNKRAADFRAFVSSLGGTMERLPDGSFKESGTGVNAAVVSFTAPGLN